VTDTKTNIFLGRNQIISLVNLSASVQNVNWVYSDNSTSLVNSTWSEIELFRGEDNSTYYGTRTNTTAIQLISNSTSDLNESYIGFLKGLNNATVRQNDTSINEANLLDFSTIVSSNSIMKYVNLFDVSTLNSSSDQITQLGKTATILSDETVTNNNLISYITQNIDISGSMVTDTKTNIFLGRNQIISLVNLSASVQNVNWVYSDNSTSNPYLKLNIAS
jgi:hypothetical protein